MNDERDFETAFATLGQEKVGALVVPGGAFLLSRRNQIVLLAARYRLESSGRETGCDSEDFGLKMTPFRKRGVHRSSREF